MEINNSSVMHCTSSSEDYYPGFGATWIFARPMATCTTFCYTEVLICMHTMVAQEEYDFSNKSYLFEFTLKFRISKLQLLPLATWEIQTLTTPSSRREGYGDCDLQSTVQHHKTKVAHCRAQMLLPRLFLVMIPSKHLLNKTENKAVLF